MNEVVRNEKEKALPGISAYPYSLPCFGRGVGRTSIVCALIGCIFCFRSYD